MSTTSRASEVAGKVKEKVEEVVEQVDEAGRRGVDRLIDRVDDAEELATLTNQYVQEHPFKAIGMAAGIGLVVGVLLSRR